MERDDITIPPGLQVNILHTLQAISFSIRYSILSSRFESLHKDKMSTDDSNSASMLGGHAQYAKGYVEEAIGNVTGSKEWQESGKNDTQAGIAEMKVSCVSLTLKTCCELCVRHFCHTGLTTALSTYPEPY